MSKIGRNDPCPCGRRGGPGGRPAPAARMGLEDDDGFDEASNRVVDLVHAGQLDEAEHAARELLDRYPDVHDGFERLGMVYEARGDRVQAAEYYRQALTFMENNADGYDAEAIDWMRAKAESLEQNP